MKVKIFPLISILMVVILFGISATCNMCGINFTSETTAKAVEENKENNIDSESAEIKETVKTAATTDGTKEKTEESNKPNTTDSVNNSPIINDISIIGTLFTNKLYDVTALASDPDGDNLSYTWTVSGGYITETVANLMKWTTDTMGDYIIKVKVIDGKGGEVTKSKTVSVGPPSILSRDITKVIAEGGYISQDGYLINAGGSLYAGDESTNRWVAGFISFDITELTDAIILDASLTFNAKQKWGDPSFYSSIAISDLFWGPVPISTASLIASNTIEFISLANEGNFTINNAILKTDIQAAINAGQPRFQIGASPFGAFTNNNNSWDGIEWDQSGITLSIDYIP